MDSQERPWGAHDLEERVCEHCGELFYAHHGLQRYCTEKNGRRNFCKGEQKKLVSEKRLADLTEKLAKSGVNVYAEIDPTEKNIAILSEELGPYNQKTVTSVTLDSKGYSMPHYTARVPKSESNDLLLVIGQYTLDWIGQNGDILIFKITKS